MLRVAISSDLERRLRREVGHPEGRDCGVWFSLLEELVAEIDLTRVKKEKEKEKERKGEPGLNYKDLVSLFRFHLGDDLIVPKKPSPVFIVRTVAEARRQGISRSNVETICHSVRLQPPPYYMDTIVRFNRS